MLLLTNATRRLDEDLRLLGLDPAAFLRALEQLGHTVEDTVCCDDSASNVAAARDLGIDVVQVSDTAALASALVARGLAPRTVLLVLPDRDEAEEVAASLRTQGWAPCDVHRDMLAGEDDAEDVDWIVELTTAPDGSPAIARRLELDALAEAHEGFTGDHWH